VHQRVSELRVRVAPMAEPTNTEYHARAGAYRLLVAQAALTLADNPAAPAVHSHALDEAMADRHLRDIVTCLASMALGGFIERYGGDVEAAIATIVRELSAAEDLASLDGDQ
jgi:hypothetical protein